MRHIGSRRLTSGWERRPRPHCDGLHGDVRRQRCERSFGKPVSTRGPGGAAWDERGRRGGSFGSGHRGFSFGKTASDATVRSNAGCSARSRGALGGEVDLRNDTARLDDDEVRRRTSRDSVSAPSGVGLDSVTVRQTAGCSTATRSALAKGEAHEVTPPASSTRRGAVRRAVTMWSRL